LTSIRCAPQSALRKPPLVIGRLGSERRIPAGAEGGVQNIGYNGEDTCGVGPAKMKIKHKAYFVTVGILVAIVWLSVAPGGDRQTPVVKPEDRVCTQDAECKLVELPCTCGQQHLAANLQHYKRYERHPTCTSAEISHCARAGASVPQSAVCRIGQCAVEAAK